MADSLSAPMPSLAYASMPEIKPAAAIVGIDISMAMRTLSFLLKPQSRAPVMATPDLEAPGTRETACQSPTVNASRSFMSPTVRAVPPFPVGPVEDNAEQDGRPADDNRVTQQIRRPGDQQGPARERHRDGGHGQPHGQLCLRCSGGSRQQLKRAAQNEPRLLSEIGQHRRQGSDMGRDVDGSAMILKSCQDRDQCQVTGGGDGQELGYPPEPSRRSADEGQSPGAPRQISGKTSA